MLIGPKLLSYHQHYMRVALKEANLAFAQGEVPVGAVAVLNDRIIASARNLRESCSDPTAHAEILALKAAGEQLGTWRLSDVILYVTLEPCPMCAGAILQARIGGLVYGANDAKAGAVGSVVDLIRSGVYPNDMDVIGGVLADECSDILQQFFAIRR